MTQSGSKNPIGVFDSGVGGLTILRAVRQALPRENLIYVADSAYVPYGQKTAEQIRERALAIAGFLLEEGAKVIVVACNTATAAAIDLLRARLPIALVGVEPAVKPAVAATRSGVPASSRRRRCYDWGWRQRCSRTQESRHWHFNGQDGYGRRQRSGRYDPHR